MLAIRLARVGAKKKPAYRVVVTDKRRARDSRSIEIVGHYNPTKDPIVLAFNDERLHYWLGQGAQPSNTVQRLMKYEGPRTSPAEKATEPKSAGYTPPPKPVGEPKPEETVAATAEARPESASADSKPEAAAAESTAEAEVAEGTQEMEAAAEAKPERESSPEPAEAETAASTGDADEPEEAKSE